MNFAGCTHVLLALLTSVTADLFQYYQPPQTPSDGQGVGDYSLYLKPVLVGKNSPVDVMYLALDGKDIFLYPSAFHTLPYPLRHHNAAQEFNHHLLNHHVENPKEYLSEDDEHFASSEDQPQARSENNSTDVSSTTQDSLPNINKETTKKLVPGRAN